jgi:serine/threonine-protein kinase
MTDDPRVEQLLDELLDSDATPEEVCGSCPELLPVVRDRWRQMRRVQADLDALFPPADTPPPPPPDEKGLPRIPGYEVEAVLGRGGMGIVFRARQLRLDRSVALKMALAGAYAGPREKERFQREAEAVARLRHPNVVQIYDVGEADGRPYFTMELVDGGSLAQKLAGTPQPARQAAELVVTLARAMQAAHECCGLVHRDLKPGNILLAADGTPKISDFGVARRVGDGGGLTQTGVLVGTPSYMAPEQAQGRPDALGPAVDVYALGAILYELLTGRPPFRAATAAETVRQVIAEEPAPPSRLNAKVPRDLETICLKCLHKAPTRRYAAAKELAEDLHRFLEGKPVRARPVGTAERIVKWARRRPAAAMLVGALLVMSAAAASIGVWLHQQETGRQAARSQREGQAREAIETALRRAGELQQDERWRVAALVLTEASTHVADAPELDQRLRRALADIRIADDLERIRESRPRKADDSIDHQQRAADYRQVFDRAGFRVEGDVEATVAAIQAAPIRDQLLAAIDDWALAALMLKDGPSVERLLRIGRLADPEPRWGDRFRDPAVWQSGDRLRELADAAFATSPPPPGYQVALLGMLLRERGGGNRNTRLLGEACRRQPGNFWLSREMGAALFAENRVDQSAGYYRAALAVQPESAWTHFELAVVFFITGQIDEAIAEHRRAVELAPNSPTLHSYLVHVLAETGYWKEAAAECRRALEINPGDYRPPLGLANNLMDNGRYDDAVIMFHRAIESNPNEVNAHLGLGILLSAMARHEEAARAFRTQVQLTPADPYARHRLAQELAAAGHPVEAIAELQAATALGSTPDGIYLDLGKLLRSQGRPEEAAAAFQLVAHDPWHALDGVAAARLDQGRFKDARAATQRLLDLPVSEPARRPYRRQLDLCDALLAIDARLPAILSGQGRPTDVPTQLALAEWCSKHKRLTATATGFYASVLVAQPSLADDLEAGHRFHAACVAALTGCGVGADASKIDDRRRADCRKQALDWLTADCNARAERHRLGKSGDRTVVATTVRSWQQNQDLSGVRDEPALARLPTDERRAWQILWAKVATLAARDPAAKFNQARAHAARQEWAKAVTCYAEGMELEPTDNGDLWFEYAAVQLLAGDRPAYRRTCAHLLARCQPAGPLRPYLVARACTLAPDSTDDPTQPLRLSANELQGRDAYFWALTEQAALHFRTGQPKDTILRAERSLTADGRPGRAVLNWLWLALACQKLGNPDEAQRWLDRAANWLDQQGGQMPCETPVMGSHLHNWLEAHALLQEARAQLR